MSTEETFEIISTDYAATSRIGRTIGRALRGGETVILVSDLGGGKTALIKSIVKGAGSEDDVTSPSFTISNLYSADKLKLHHYDFYRLDEPGIMKSELEEVLDNPEVVVMIEWGQIVEDILPADTIKIVIQVIDQNSRKFQISAPERFSYLTESIKA